MINDQQILLFTFFNLRFFLGCEVDKLVTDHFKMLDIFLLGANKTGRIAVK